MTSRMITALCEATERGDRLTGQRLLEAAYRPLGPAMVARIKNRRARTVRGLLQRTEKRLELLGYYIHGQAGRPGYELRPFTELRLAQERAARESEIFKD